MCTIAVSALHGTVGTGTGGKSVYCKPMWQQGSELKAKVSQRYFSVLIYQVSSFLFSSCSINGEDWTLDLVMQQRLRQEHHKRAEMTVVDVEVTITLGKGCTVTQCTAGCFSVGWGGTQEPEGEVLATHFDNFLITKSHTRVENRLYVCH